MPVPVRHPQQLTHRPLDRIPDAEVADVGLAVVVLGQLEVAGALEVDIAELDSLVLRGFRAPAAA